MTQPIILDYLTQIFTKHYKLEPNAACEQADRFLEILELYGMQVIIGEWTVPERQVVTLDPFEMMAKIAEETIAREPWNAPELKN